jgi:hypothetical protein
MSIEQRKPRAIILSKTSIELACDADTNRIWVNAGRVPPMERIAIKGAILAGTTEEIDPSETPIKINNN